MLKRVVLVAALAMTAWVVRDLVKSWNVPTKPPPVAVSTPSPSPSPVEVKVVSKEYKFEDDCWR